MNQILSFPQANTNGGIIVPLDARRWTKVINIIYLLQIISFTNDVYQSLEYISSDGNTLAASDFGSSINSATNALCNWQTSPNTIVNQTGTANGVINGNIPNVFMPPGSSLKLNLYRGSTTTSVSNMFIIAKVVETEHEFEEDILHKLHELLGRNNASPASNG